MSPARHAVADYNICFALLRSLCAMMWRVVLHNDVMLRHALFSVLAVREHLLPPDADGLPQTVLELVELSLNG